MDAPHLIQYDSCSVCVCVSCSVLTSSWEISVLIEEPILPFMILPPPVMVPVSYSREKKDTP